MTDMKSDKPTTAVSSKNEVMLQGVIVHKFVTPHVAILTINTGSATPVPNYPKVLFFGDLRGVVEEKFDTKDHVTITGNIQSSKRKENVKNQIMQSIFGESIELTRSVIEEEFGLPETRSRKPYVNRFIVEGTVTAVDSPSQNIIRITLRTMKNGHVSFGKYVYYTKNPEKFLANVHAKDTLCAVGCVQTTRSQKDDGEMRYYQNYVLTELVKRPPSDAK